VRKLRRGTIGASHIQHHNKLGHRHRTQHRHQPMHQAWCQQRRSPGHWGAGCPAEGFSLWLTLNFFSRMHRRHRERSHVRCFAE
jgi:hypothetical protein